MVLQLLMAMVFSVGEVNKTPLLLPIATLRYAIYDFCYSGRQETRTALQILGPNFVTTGIDECGPHALIGAIREYSVYSFLPEVWLEAF